MKTIKKCLHCQQPFIPTRSDARYCGVRCRWNAWRERKEGQQDLKVKSSKSKMLVHPSSIQLLTDSTWDFAHSILWSDYPFSSAEVELCKLFIKEYYEEIPAEKFTATAHKHFTGYCERILLAKKYVSRFSHRYIPHPCIWLNKLNPKGFAGTKVWYLRNLEKRGQKISICKKCGESFSLNPILNHFHFTA